MQSAPFLPSTDSEDDAYSSDSSGDLPQTHNIGVTYGFEGSFEGKRFLDQSRQDTYLQLRNELFTIVLKRNKIFYQHSILVDVLATVCQKVKFLYHEMQ